MYERTYGYRYRELGEHPSAAEIAKAVRADVKQAVAEGLLPASWRYSVTSDNYAGGCSVDVKVLSAGQAWMPCDGGRKCGDVWCSARNDPKYAHAAQSHHVLTDEAEAAEVTLKRIHNAYNHDGSESQIDYFDVRYYGIVTFERLDEERWIAKHREEQKVKRDARASGEPAGLVAVFGRQRQTVHVLVELADGTKRLACGAQLWRSSVYQRVADADVTCSRCAKRHQSA